MAIEEKEKAKAYDLAMERLKPFYERAKKEGTSQQSFYEYILPDLKKSEDEKTLEMIEKSLYKLLFNKSITSDEYKRMISWLKKHKDTPPEVDEREIIDKHITEDSLSSDVNARLKKCGWHVEEETADEEGNLSTSLATPELNFIGIGDIVAFYQTWRGKERRCLALIGSYDYGHGKIPGSAPRALFGRNLGNTWMCDWAPCSYKYYDATPEEKKLLLSKVPAYVKERVEEVTKGKNYESL